MATAKLQAKAGKLNIVIEQGATFNPDMIYKDAAGAVIDLTGYTARMQIRETKESVTLLEELTTENGGLTITAALGKISVLITATATAAYTWESGVYDVELIDPSSVVTRVLTGSVVVDNEVTR